MDPPGASGYFSKTFCFFDLNGARMLAMNQDLLTDLKQFITATTAQQTAELRLDIRKLQQDVTILQKGQEELYAGQEQLSAGQRQLQIGQEQLRIGYGQLRVNYDELRADYDELRVGQEQIRSELQQLRTEINDKIDNLTEAVAEAITESNDATESRIADHEQRIMRLEASVV